MRSLLSILLFAACGSGHTPRTFEGLPGPVHVLGHRGAAGLGPENTLPAMDAAAALGVGFELDVTLSADGEVVVIHDDSVDRTTDGEGEVSELPWSSLQALDAGAWYDAAYAGTGLPTLDQVLERFAGKVPIDIELKTTPRKAELAKAVVAAVKRHDATGSVFVTSFDPYLLEQVALAEPAIRRGQLTSRFKGADLNAIEKLVLRRMWLNGKSQPDAIAVEDARASKGFVRRWQRRGYAVLVWTVDDPARIRELREIGVDGVITDRPDSALEAWGS